MGGVTLGACASEIAGYGGTAGHCPPLAPSARNGASPHHAGGPLVSTSAAAARCLPLLPLPAAASRVASATSPRASPLGAAVRWPRVHRRPGSQPCSSTQPHQPLIQATSHHPTRLPTLLIQTLPSANPPNPSAAVPLPHSRPPTRHWRAPNHPQLPSSPLSPSLPSPAPSPAPHPCKYTPACRRPFGATYKCGCRHSRVLAPCCASPSNRSLHL